MTTRRLLLCHVTLLCAFNSHVHAGTAIEGRVPPTELTQTDGQTGTPASQTASPRQPVAVDWSAVSAGIIARCGLGGLQNLLIQALIELNYAVVANATQGDIELVVREDAAGLVVEARHGDDIERRVVPIPGQCDSTIAVEIAYEAKQVLRSITARLALATVPEGSNKEELPILAAPLGGVARSWRAQAGAGVVVGSPGSVSPLLRLGGIYPMSGALLAQASVECGAAYSSGLFVAEPVVAARVSGHFPITPWLVVEPGVEVGLVGHVYRFEDAPAGGLVTGRLGLPVTLAFPGTHLSALVMPFLRQTPVTHRVDGREAYRADHLGLLAALLFDTQS